MITIKGVDFEVLEVDEIEKADNSLAEEGTVVLGAIDVLRSTVMMRNDLSPTQQEQTFWHEVTHGICLNEDVDELMIGRISSDLYNFLKQNELLEEGWLENYIDREESGVEINVSDAVRAMDGAAEERLAR